LLARRLSAQASRQRCRRSSLALSFQGRAGPIVPE
jgi:hypothetical protein